MNLKAYQKNLL